MPNAMIESLVVYPWTSPLALRIVLHVVRNSDGFNKKKTNACSLNDIAAKVRAPRSSVHLALEVLVKSNVILRDSAGCLALQKNFENWAAPVQPTGQHSRRAVQSTGQQTVFSSPSVAVQPTGQEDPRQLSSPLDSLSSPLDSLSSPLDTYKEKDNLKDNSKDTHITAPPAAVAGVREPLEGFSEWYADYPEKKARGAAERAWKRIKPDAELQAKLRAAVAAQKIQRERDEKAGVFVPRWAYPASWLNQKRWEDELTPAAASVNRTGVRAAAGKYDGIGERHDLA